MLPSIGKALKRRASERFDEILLALIAAAVIVPRLVVSSCIEDFSADGSYYTDVALHVRDGDGLLTDVSVFHQGFQKLPHPTSVYPLWPLLYGYVARLSDIATVGVWLPTTLYFVVVLLAAALGERFSRGRLFAGLPLHAGHLFALMFALNPQFIKSTARPYTEGLAFTMLLAMLLRAPSLWRAPGLRSGLELGAWLVMLLLVRSQFLVVTIAAVGAGGVLWLARKGGIRERILFAAGAVSVFAAVWSVYVRWLGTFLPDASLGTYLRFDSSRASDLLSEVPIMAQTHGAAEKIEEMMNGLSNAFSIFEGTNSYQTLHRGAAYLIPLALLGLSLQWRRWPVWWRFLRGPRGAEAAFLHLIALGLTASLHTVHKVYGSSWVFGSRHAIPSILLVFLSAIFLLRQRSSVFLRSAAIFLLSAGLYTSYRLLAVEAQQQCETARRSPPIHLYRAQTRAFLERQRASAGELTVAVERPEAQLLSWRTEGVGFHWLTESTTVRDLEQMVRVLSVDYVLLFEDLNNNTVRKEPAFEERFVLIETFKEIASDSEEEEARPKGARRATWVYAPRCSAFPEAPSCSDAP